MDEDEEGGVDDRVADELEIRSSKYERTVQEQRARKKVDMPTNVQGISRDEYVKGMLRDDERFRDV